MNLTFDISSGEAIFDGVKIDLDRYEEVFRILGDNTLNVSSAVGVSKEFRPDQKFMVLGESASLSIVIEADSVKEMCVLFDKIAFFERSIFESKIMNRFEKKYKVSFESSHPAVAKVKDITWGSACFLYDPRQGDLSLCLGYSDI